MTRLHCSRRARGGRQYGMMGILTRGRGVMGDKVNLHKVDLHKMDFHKLK